MIPARAAFLSRWPYRTRGRGPALAIADELLVWRERRRLRELDLADVETVVAGEGNRPSEVSDPAAEGP